VSRPERNLVLTDVHVPWQDKRLCNAVFKLARDFQFDGLYLGGDTLDMYTLSRHHANSLYHLKGLTLTDEYRMGNEFMDDLCSAVGKKCSKRRKIWGNHEAFHTRWLHEQDHDKLGKELGSPTQGLRLRERGFKVKENWQNDSWRIGSHLELVHGLFTTTHPAYAHMARFGGSVIHGHTHRFNTFITGSAGGFNIGGLFDKKSKGFNYASHVQKLQWCPGFAVAYVFDDGSYNVHPINCWRSRFVFEGKEYA
jgi:predicted phosphodiesterase